MGGRRRRRLRDRAAALPQRPARRPPRARLCLPDALRPRDPRRGAVSLLALVAWAVTRARRRPAPGDRGRPFTPERIGLVTMVSIVVIFGVHSFVDWTWFVPGNAVVALLCAAWVVGRGPLRRNAAAEARPPPAPAARPRARRHRRRRGTRRAARRVGGLAAPALAERQQRRRSRTSSRSNINGARAARAGRARPQPARARPADGAGDRRGAPRRQEAPRCARSSRRCSCSPPTPRRGCASPTSSSTSSKPKDALRSLGAALYLDPRNPSTISAYLQVKRRVTGKKAAVPPIQPGQAGSAPATPGAAPSPAPPPRPAAWDPVARGEAPAPLSSRRSCSPPLPRCARASVQQESTFQDDDRLVFAPADHVRPRRSTRSSRSASTASASRCSGTRSRPTPKSKTKPRFDGADPDAYPNGDWAPLRPPRARSPRRAGIGRQLRPHRARAAVGDRQPRPRATSTPTFDPDPGSSARSCAAVGQALQRRVHAAGAARGHPAAARQRRRRCPSRRCPPVCTRAAAAADAGRRRPAAARRLLGDLERAQPGRLADAAVDARTASRGRGRAAHLPRRWPTPTYGALQAHRPRQRHDPRRRDRAQGPGQRPGRDALDRRRCASCATLYCVDANFQPFRGAAGRAPRLPDDGGAGFAAPHPVLFDATGWAHHPYELIRSPHTAPRAPGLRDDRQPRSALTSTLRARYARYGSSRSRRRAALPDGVRLPDQPARPLRRQLGRQAAYLERVRVHAPTSTRRCARSRSSCSSTAATRSA